MSKTPAVIEPYIMDFLKEVYGDNVELVLSMFSEKASLIDATEMIRDLKSRRALLERVKEAVIKEHQAHDDWNNAPDEDKQEHVEYYDNMHKATVAALDAAKEG